MDYYHFNNNLCCSASENKPTALVKWTEVIWRVAVSLYKLMIKKTHPFVEVDNCVNGNCMKQLCPFCKVKPTCW